MITQEDHQEMLQAQAWLISKSVNPDDTDIPAKELVPFMEVEPWTDIQEAQSGDNQWRRERAHFMRLRHTHYVEYWSRDRQIIYVPRAELAGLKAYLEYVDIEKGRSRVTARFVMSGTALDAEDAPSLDGVMIESSLGGIDSILKQGWGADVRFDITFRKQGTSYLTDFQVAR